MWGRFSITMMRGGPKHNVIPGRAELGFDVRVPPGHDWRECLSQLKAAVASSAAALGVRFVEPDELGTSPPEVSVVVDEKSVNPGWMTDPEGDFVREVLDSYERVFGERKMAGELGGNDGFVFASRGLPTVAVGPIDKDSGFHSAPEGASEEVMIKVRDMFVDLLTG
ncbi:MAG: hypothetical protein DRO06_01955 [Thermoproteota archaeon]|nr:MAG: hypothetical protein DRO06_01955 [Candidatus Korarchaeota archaeon]